MTNTIQNLPAKYYIAGFEEGLTLAGAQDNLPQWLGNKAAWENFNTRLIEIDLGN